MNATPVHTNPGVAPGTAVAAPAPLGPLARAVRSRRRTLLGLAHKAALQLGMDEDCRRAAQKAFCGHESLRDCSDAQLIAWCWELKRRGASIGIPAPRPKGGAGWDRPTDAQLAAMERLALALGLDGGLDGSALRGFVQRTCGVDDVRFLTQRQASACISGLQRWARQRGAVAPSRTRQAIEALLGDQA